MSQKLSQFGFGAFAAPLLLVGAFASSAAPAFANSSAAADIAAPLRAAQAAKTGAEAGDPEFRQLFASWKSLDNGIVLPSTAPASIGTTASRRPTSVSIPSIQPVSISRMSSGFGMRVHPVLGGRRKHEGVDLPAPVGTPIRATADGVVEMADWFGGYGLFVKLEHGGSFETRYGHMSRIAVAAGQAVRKGDVIGYVGTTGRSTGPHLHYEVRIDGQAVNPLAYMGGTGLTVASNETLDDVGGGE